MSPPLPYFKVNICPFPLPHFASIFFAYLWSFRWPNYIVTTPEIFLVSTATFKYTYRAPLRRIGQEYSANDLKIARFGLTLSKWRELTGQVQLDIQLSVLLIFRLIVSHSESGLRWNKWEECHGQFRTEYFALNSKTVIAKFRSYVVTCRGCYAVADSRGGFGGFSPPVE